MKKIQLVEDYLKNNMDHLYFENGEPAYAPHQVEEVMIKFDKAHVERALYKASLCAEISGKWNDEMVLLDEIETRDVDGKWMSLNVDHKSILNSYPLENIV